MNRAGARPVYSKQELRMVFVRKYAELLRALVDPELKRRPWDSSLIEELARAYARLPEKARGRDMGTIPKRIHLLWQQGWDQAPPLVQACARSWADQNPGWELLLIDDATFPGYAASYGAIAAPRASRPARSDLARICLLAEHGGVWADASVFCSRGLDAWLPGVIPTAFFMFASPRPYRPVDSWFIASEPLGQVIGALREISRQYWSLFRHPHHYFWLIYLFEYLTQRDRAVGDLWRQTPRLSALGPLIVDAYAFDRQAPQQVFELIESGTVPLHKLSHKWRHRGSLAGTPLGRLTGLAHL